MLPSDLLPPADGDVLRFRRSDSAERAYESRYLRRLCNYFNSRLAVWLFIFTVEVPESFFSQVHVTDINRLRIRVVA